MSKSILSQILIALSAIFCHSLSQESWTKTEVAKGMVHHHIVRPGPYDIHLLEIDLSAPNLRLESSLARGLTKTSEQAAAGIRSGTKVLAAVNADFFSFKSQLPVGNQVHDGKIVIGLQSNRSHLVIDKFGKPHIMPLAFDGLIHPSTGDELRLSGVNIIPGRDSVVIHTEEWFDSTKTFDCAKVIHFRPAGSKWGTGESLKFVTVEGSGNTAGFGNSHICFGPGDSLFAMCKSLMSGDTLLATLKLRGFSGLAEEVIGGAGKILASGRQFTADGAKAEKIPEDFLIKRHPRTFVGFDKDTTKFWIGVVDGRQAHSIGMNFQEMGDLLLSLGITEALNFDGGGSTTMVVNRRIVNSPSDKTGERPVANVLEVVEVP